MAKIIKTRKTLISKGNGNSIVILHQEKDFKRNLGDGIADLKPGISFDTESAVKSKLLKFAGIKAKKVEPYLTLSPKTPFIKDKGYFTATRCNSYYPGSISFLSYPMENIGPGKLEIWLEGLTSHSKMTVEIRLSGASYNNKTEYYEVRSSMASGLYGYFPVKLNSKIDLYFPDVHDFEGQGLITIEPKSLTGSWLFYDAKVSFID
ncbi:MAG TPA: hypothetical protein PKA90_06085 [Ignavibacteria bacterium]|nr:hypothetical protein [Ignavibacteria bacterium]HMR39983.1 hypothetical protein [Ignavibacteria bacterium]